MYKNRYKQLFTALAFLCTALASSAAPVYRPEKEMRTVTQDAYQLVIQKDGQTDINLSSTDAVLNNLRPEVELDQREDPLLLPTDWKRTHRAEVNDALGEGQGMVHEWPQYRWQLNTYPTKPFLTIQFTFINRTNEPLFVKKLIPLATDPGAGGLSLGGPAADNRLLNNGQIFALADDFPEVATGSSTSEWNIAAWSPASGRSLIAGFLTSKTAWTQFQISAGPKDLPQYQRFRAECVYDPPRELKPGEELTAEILYLAVAETSVLEGLQRFARAQAVWNNIKPESAFLPHGWDSWSTHYGRDISESALLNELEVLDKQLKRYGWNHFAIDAGWEQTRGDWEAAPDRFPHGMAALAEAVHARGMTAGLWVAPFAVDIHSQLAQQHPDWLALPDARGRLVMGENERILDVTVPEAYAFTRDLCRRITHEWGFDALVEADYVYYLLLAEKYSQPGVTKVEALRLGMQAIREGLGEDKFLMTMTPHPINASYAQGIRVGRDCAPIWRAANHFDSWGAVDALTNAARRFYMAPHLYYPDQDCAFFSHPDVRKRWESVTKPDISFSQSVAWLTGAALTGGVVKIGNAFSTLNDTEIAVLRKLLPAPPKPAIPVGLFQPEPPRIWFLPLKTEAGEWNTLALFNWDESKPARIPVSFADLSLPRDRYYTVFDFWHQHYYGTATGNLEVEVAPGSVQLLCLRPLEDRPMLLGADRHYTQGALEYSVLRWNPADRTLHGEFEAVADTDYRISFLVPEAFQQPIVESSLPVTGQQFESRVFTLQVKSTTAGPAHWTLQF